MPDIYGSPPADLSGDFYGGHPWGVLAEEVPTDGLNGASYLAQLLDMPADTGKRIRAPIIRWPAGTLQVSELGEVDYSGATDYALARLYVDGVASTEDNGLGAGVFRIDFSVGATAVLGGDVPLDAVAPGGVITSGNASGLVGDVALDGVGTGGSFDGGPVPSGLSGDVALGSLVPGGGFIGDTSELVPIMSTGLRVITPAWHNAKMLDPLDVAEVDNLCADFTDFLPADDPIADVGVQCTARVGTDSAPTPLLYGLWQMNGRKVFQRIYGSRGVQNVVYLLRVTAFTTSGRVLVAAGFVRVVRKA